MANVKRYYWLKLHDDFFDSKRIKKLRRLAGGDTYTIIYLKLQLLAMKSEGVITYTHLEDSIADELALDLDESADDIKVTLTYLLSCGLMETSDNINFFLPYSIANTGSETASTQRSRECRARQKVLQCNTNATQVQQHCNVEREKIQEKDTREKIQEREESHPHTKKYGKYENVILADDEYEKLKQEFPRDYEQKINNLSGYMKTTGKVYASHFAVIEKWAEEDKKQKGESTIDMSDVGKSSVLEFIKKYENNQEGI